MVQPVIPYLTVDGASDAIAFYQAAFGARENVRLPADDGKRLVHAEIAVNGGVVFLSDEFPEYHNFRAPKTAKGSGFAVALALAAPREVDALYRQAIAAGAQALMEPADMYWGARFAMLADPFGHRWMLNAPRAAQAA